MESESSEFELDLPPEYCHYHDDGCELFQSCLNCPLPHCVYELRGGKRRWLKRQRNREIARAFTAQKKRVRELALDFGVSQRTVQRVLRGYLSTEKEDKNE